MERKIAARHSEKRDRATVTAAGQLAEQYTLNSIFTPMGSYGQGLVQKEAAAEAATTAVVAAEAAAAAADSAMTAYHGYGRYHAITLV